MSTPLSVSSPVQTRRGLRALGARALSPLAAVALAAAAVLVPMGSAQAAARVDVSSSLGGRTASATGPTTLSLRVHGFQSIKGGFGGIYVLFGWVDSGDRWRPSKGGVTGTDYRYIPDSESKTNHGYQRFVSFPGSETEGAANGGLLRADGTWATTLTVPSPVFDSVDRNGRTTRVDCRTMRCGVITVGAHGVKNLANETFTPITFTGGTAAAGTGRTTRTPARQGAQQRPATSQQAPGQAARQGTGRTTTGTAGQGQATPAAQNPSAQNASAPGGTAQNTTAQDSTTQNQTGQDQTTQGQVAQDQVAQDPAAAGQGDTEATAQGSTTGDTTATGADAAAPAAARASKPAIGLQEKSLAQGSVLSFTAQGFRSGEQVVGTLDRGTTAAGPFRAGSYGDIAGTVPLPGALRPGTHVLSMTGAATGTTARVTFTVTAATATPVAAGAEASGSSPWDVMLVVLIAVAALTVVLLVVAAITALLRRRAQRRAVAAPAPSDGTADDGADEEAKERAEGDASPARDVPNEGLPAFASVTSTPGDAEPNVWPTDHDSTGGRHRPGSALALLVAGGVAAAMLSLPGAPAARAESPSPSPDPQGGIAVGVTIPGTNDADHGAISGASFEWGLNAESGGGAYSGGGDCNFLVAGAVPDVGSSHRWTAQDGARAYRAQSGNVSISHPRANGKAVIPTWATKCRDAAGKTVTPRANSSTYNTTRIMGGTGTYDVPARTAKVAWKGSTTVVFYGGLTYWTFSDPVLTLTPTPGDASTARGTVTATLTGYGADMNDTSKWVRLPSRTITMATLTGVKINATGITTTPQYRHVAVTTPAAVTPQYRTGEDWGSFPQAFVDYQVQTGQSSYWYSSGGLADSRKPASPLVVRWDAAKNPGDSGSAVLPPGPGNTDAPSGGAVPVGPGGDGAGGDGAVVPVGGGDAAGVPGGDGIDPAPGSVAGGGASAAGVGGSGGAIQPGAPAGGSVQPAGTTGGTLGQALGASGLAPAASAAAGATPSAAPAAADRSEGALTSPSWQGGTFIPTVARTAFGTPLRAGVTAGVLALLIAAIVVGIRKGWLALPFLRRRS